MKLPIEFYTYVGMATVTGICIIFMLVAIFILVGIVTYFRSNPSAKYDALLKRYDELDKNYQEEQNQVKSMRDLLESADDEIARLIKKTLN